MTIDRDYTLAHRLYKAIRTHVSLTFLSFVKFALWLKCLVQQKRYTDFIGNYFLLMYSPFRSFFVSRFLKAIFKEIFFFSTSCHAASLTFIVENLESLIRIQLCVQQRINTREKFLKINQIDCVHKDVNAFYLPIIFQIINRFPRDRGLINIIYRNILAFILRSDHHLKVYKKKKINLSFAFIQTTNLFIDSWSN